MIHIHVIDQRAVRIIASDHQGKLMECSYKQLADMDGEWETTDAVIVYSRAGNESVDRLVVDMQKGHNIDLEDRIRFLRKTEIDAALSHQMHNKPRFTALVDPRID